MAGYDSAALGGETAAVLARGEVVQEVGCPIARGGVQYGCLGGGVGLGMNQMLIGGTTRCGQGEKVFHVETTAWEGEGAWHGKPSVERSNTTEPATAATSRDLFANYGSYFWSKQG